MSHKSTPADQNQDLRLNKRLKDTPIAIVGMASVFANSRYLNEYWDLISEKIDGIIDVPESHWKTDDFYDSEKNTPDKVYCKRGGFLPEVEFNPMEFGLPPNILEVTDSSQLLSLVVAKEVLADAKLADDVDRDRIGITLGVGGGQKISQSMNGRLQHPILRKVFKQSGINDEDSEMLLQKVQDQYVSWEENSFPGSLGNVIAGRIANRFDLGGMNCVVDAACAGSLAAIRMALTELVEGRSDMMITGGVCTDNSPYMYMSFSQTPAFTDQEQIKPFDADSNGMMIGEGIGMIAIKRLEDAERDGDRIYSVIKGIGSSSDGKFKSIYAPRPEGQVKALKRAYDDAGFAPHTVGLIEAHGTGTAAGDLAEFNGLHATFSEDNQQTQHIALGSIKSQIGHTKSTAGTAGLIKASLALHHKVLPATINVKQPNPKLKVEQSPFYLNTETRPWLAKSDNTPRRAGISSFGFGGTNFHVVLEEYSQEHTRDNQYRQSRVASSLLFAAASSTPLQQNIQSVLADLKDEKLTFKQVSEQYALKSVASNHARLGLVAMNTEDLITQLTAVVTRLKSADDNWTLPSGASYRKSSLTSNSKSKVAALFAGQGSQYLNMAIELACNFPEGRHEFETADKIFAENEQPLLSSKVFPIPAFSDDERKQQQQQLTDTAFAQSAIGATSMAQFELLKQAGFSVDMVGGHSFGELSALHAAGVINKQDYYQLAFARGQSMANVPDGKDAGSMMAVIVPDATSRPKLVECLKQFDGVKVANDNSPTQQVIAGPSDALADCGKALSQLGFKAIALPVSGAFHTELVAHAQAPFADAIKATKFNPSTCTVFSNATGQAYQNDATVIQTEFQQHMLQSVCFAEQIQQMYQAGARIFVEFGPKDILQKLVKANLAEHEDEICVVSANPTAKGNSDKQLRLAATQLVVAGIELNNIDPYQAEIVHLKPAKGMTLKINGANYVSPATQQKMQKSLNNGQVKSRIEYVDRPVEVIVEKEVEKEVIKEIVKTVEAPLNQNNNNHVSTNISANNNQPRIPVAQTNPTQNVSNDALGSFFAAQDQVAKLHQQFLDIPKQYGDTFATLMTEQAKLAAQGIAIPESLLQSMQMFHQHQSQTLQSHEQFMQLQASQNQAALSLLHTNTVQTDVAQVVSIPATMPQKSSVQTLGVRNLSVQAPEVQPYVQAQIAPMTEPKLAAVQSTPIVEPVAAPAALQSSSAVISSDQIQQVMLAVVADKTGYPTEMLDLSMDMEADLGIDSIKRVEILGTVQDELSTLPELNPEDLAECRTLGEIVSYMNDQLDAGSVSPIASITSVTTLSRLSAEQVQQTMLSVVADKTGYPTEMLDLAMDMEADLGIDSIKRVEILGTVQDELPELPELNPEDLAECRTLGEIVNYMNAQIEPSSTNTSIFVADAAIAATNTLSAEQVQQTMLAVVADKTGYPTEMLDLAMDMEADLGIDSIKRVEILGTVQDELPELPELNPEDLSECRTLGEIVSYMNSKLDSPVETPLETSIETVVTASTSSLSTEQVQQTMLEVVADKTGYPVDMLDLAMDMEADLGIDSIKRVEILGTVQDQLAELPDLNPEDLAECRTLGEIVTYMNGHVSTVQPDADVSGANVAQASASKTIKTPELVAELNIELPPHSEVTLKKLSAAVNFNGQFPQNGVIIIADDGQNAGLVAEKLSAKGLIVAVIHAPQSLLNQQSPLSTDIHQFMLETISDEAVSSVLTQVSALGQVAGFIHLQPVLIPESISVESKNVALSDLSKAHVELAFLWAKHLQPLLNEELNEELNKELNEELNSVNSDNRKSYLSVSRMDGGFGYYDSAILAKTELNQGALSGLTKTLSHEWPSVFCRALDIAPDIETLNCAEAIVTELFAQHDGLTEIAINSQGRHTLVTAPVSEIHQQAAKLSQNDKILVTGGAKGVTLKCALELAKMTQAHFILAGRSQYLAQAQLPSWAKDKAPAELQAAAITELKHLGKKPTPKSVDALIAPVKSSHEIHQSLLAFAEVGASAEYLSLDVNNAQAVESTLSNFNAITSITGLIHGAGVLADRYIQDKTLDELARVYGTKVNGLHHILNVIDVEQLKLCALFSSAAGFYGNEGQSDYAMANEILNKSALQLAAKYPAMKVISFDWGPWDGGMVNATLKKMFNDRGVYVIPLDAGAKLFANKILSESGSQIIVGSTMQGSDIQGSDNASTDEQESQVKKRKADLTHSEELLLNPHNLGFIEQHQLNGNPVLPTVCALQWFAQSASQQLDTPVMVRDYQLLKGVVFDSNKTKLLSLALTTDNSGVNGKISCDGKLQYQAQLTSLSEEGSSFELSVDTQNLAEFSLKGVELYRNGTLFHGAQLQGIHAISHYSDKGLIAEIKLPKLNIADFGNFTPTEQHQPIAADCLLQAMLVWAKLKYNCASLPVSIGEFVSVSALAENEVGSLKLQIIKHNARSMTADITLHHADGRLSCYMKQAKVTLSKSLTFQPYESKKMSVSELEISGAVNS